MRLIGKRSLENSHNKNKASTTPSDGAFILVDTPE